MTPIYIRALSDIAARAMSKKLRDHFADVDYGYAYDGSSDKIAWYVIIYNL